MKKFVENYTRKIKGVINQSIENYVPWVPIEGSEQELFFVSLAHPLGNELIIEFDRGLGTRPLLVQFTDPTAHQYCSYDIYPGNAADINSFYTVCNSSYTQYVRGRSLGMLDSHTFYRGAMIHYTFITIDGCVDVLSHSCPEVYWEPDFLACS